jgi:hypothetical protein
MNLTTMRKGILAGLLAAAAVVPASAQMAQDDIVVGMSSTRSATTQPYRVYTANTNTWSSTVPAWAPTFIQSIMFDNAKFISHNARGNLLGANFGNSYTGFEVYNLATDGTANSSSIWSIVTATGGTKGVNGGTAWVGDRGAGISVSPCNSYFAWASSSGKIYVHNYLPGSNPGSGAGASIAGPRVTSNGALSTSGTQATAWLNDWTLIAFNSYGEIVKLDLRNHPVGGSENNTMAGWQPEVMTDWVIANNEVAISSQYASIVYNPAICPNLIFASATLTTFEAHLYVYNYNPVTGAISLAYDLLVPPLPDNSSLEPRQISLDSAGNLYYCCYCNNSKTSGNPNLVAKFTGACDLANWADASLITSFYVDTYSAYNGLDVAATVPTNQLLGDLDGDGHVNTTDLLRLATSWNDGRPFHAYWEGDINRDGRVDIIDVLTLADNWGK